MSLRKEKAARLKLGVLEHTLKLIGKRAFDDLYVDDICDKVKISKVTLFKYFPTKEDILSYYFRIWCLRRLVELRAKPKEGLQGAYYIFEKFGEDAEHHPGIILHLISYLANMRRSLKPFPVKLEEKQLLFPNVADVGSIDIMSVDQMFEKFALEAILRKEITKISQTRELANLFNTMLYGSVVTAHINQISPVKIFMKRNLDLALRGLQ